MFQKSKHKIFCVSTQRTGTTSVGNFFKEFGYHVADYYTSRDSEWSYFWEIGDFESIFNSKEFKKHQVFEDDPWWLPEFYKVLYHRFPKAKFILFTRDANAWFQSMINHSGGKTLGNTKRHSKVYRREQDFYDLFSTAEELLTYDAKKVDNLLSMEGHAAHYKKIYDNRNKEIVDFFNLHAPSSLFVARLEDPNKWQDLGAFFGIDVPENYKIHSNKSDTKEEK